MLPPCAEQRPEQDTASGAPSHASDLELARRALDGSIDARREFAERMRCVPKFLAVLNGRLGRPLADADLEDLAQETLITVWRRLESYAGLAALETWCYAFCHYGLSESIRRKARRPDGVRIEELVDEERSEWAVDTELLLQAIEKLAQRDALVVRYKHFEKLSLAEIARRTGVPFGSVRKRYYRALGRLREILEPSRKEGKL